MELTHSASRAATVTNTQVWAGRIITTLVVLFMIFDGVAKLMKVPQVVESTAELGFPEHSIPLIGGLLLVCTAAYVIPDTAVLGAILLTGYLGGATAANLRIGHPLFETVFPIGFAALIWAGIGLRDGRLRELIPVRRTTPPQR
jgi:DoxX-like family